MFVGKSSRIIWVLERYSTWVGYSFPCKHYTNLESLSKDKHSSLLRKSVNYVLKMFYNIGLWSTQLWCYPYKSISIPGWPNVCWQNVFWWKDKEPTSLETGLTDETDWATYSNFKKSLIWINSKVDQIFLVNCNKFGSNLYIHFYTKLTECSLVKCFQWKDKEPNLLQTGLNDVTDWVTYSNWNNPLP